MNAKTAAAKEAIVRLPKPTAMDDLGNLEHSPDD